MMAAQPNSDQFDDLPDAMRAARRWLVWRSLPQAGKKPRKVPVYANGVQRNGLLDTAEDMARLATFDEACAALATGHYAGLGFALGPDGTGNVWQGVDLDDVPARPELRLIADDLPGYTETSPSGNGLHAIGYGRPFAALGSNGTGIEAYSSGRYFTVTGEGAGLGEPGDIADFVAQVLAPRHGLRPAPVSAEVMEYIDPRTTAELRSALSAMRADDRELWIANGQRLKKLGETGRGLWLEWSQQSDKFDPADAARVWDSFTADRTGHQAVFADAQRRGWLNPMSGAAALPAPVAPAPLAESVRNALAPLTVADIEAAKIPHPHAFATADGQRGLFPEAEVTVIGAPGREGKTTMVMAILTHYVLGRPLAGMGMAQVRSAVVYSAEDDRGQYARKAAAQWSRMVPDDQRLLLDNLLIPDLHSPELAAWREIVRLEHRQPVRGPVVELLIDAINDLKGRDCPPGLVVFETASTLSDAEEDNPGHKALIAALKHVAKATGLAVVLVHHTSQGAAAKLPALDISEADIRGGTTLVNNARQTHLVVNLGSTGDPFPDADARTLLRRLVAPGESGRVAALVCLSSSKSADPSPIFFRWDDVPPYGPRMVAIEPPERVRGKSWRGVRSLLAAEAVEATADKKAAQGEANVRLCVAAVAQLAEAGEQPTAAKVSAKCGRNPSWAKPYLLAAVELGDLVRVVEQVPHVRGMADVYRPAGEGARPWVNNDSMTDSMPWNKKSWSAE